MPATLAQINISGGGMPKYPVPEAQLTFDGLAGDWQLDRKHHGGPGRAVCLYSLELYQVLRELGVELTAGQLGENLTTRGLDLMQLKPGDRLRVGGCIMEITEARIPCASLDRWDPKLKQVMVDRPGWLARVISEGMLHTGDTIRIISEDE